MSEPMLAKASFEARISCCDKVASQVPQGFVDVDAREVWVGDGGNFPGRAAAACWLPQRSFFSTPTQRTEVSGENELAPPSPP